MDTPACGISIGFERIITILMDSGFKKEQFGKVVKAAQEERARGVRVAVAQMNKNKKFQKEQLAKEGFEEFVEFYKDSI